MYREKVPQKDTFPRFFTPPSSHSAHTHTQMDTCFLQQNERKGEENFFCLYPYNNTVHTVVSLTGSSLLRNNSILSILLNSSLRNSTGVSYAKYRVHLPERTPFTVSPVVPIISRTRDLLRRRGENRITC